MFLNGWVFAFNLSTNMSFALLLALWPIAHGAPGSPWEAAWASVGAPALSLENFIDFFTVNPNFLLPSTFRHNDHMRSDILLAVRWNLAAYSSVGAKRFDGAPRAWASHGSSRGLKGLATHSLDLTIELMGSAGQSPILITWHQELGGGQGHIVFVTILNDNKRSVFPSYQIYHLLI